MPLPRKLGYAIVSAAAVGTLLLIWVGWQSLVDRPSTPFGISDKPGTNEPMVSPSAVTGRTTSAPAAIDRASQGVLSVASERAAFAKAVAETIDAYASGSFEAFVGLQGQMKIPLDSRFQAKDGAAAWAAQMRGISGATIDFGSTEVKAGQVAVAPGQVATRSKRRVDGERVKALGEMSPPISVAWNAQHTGIDGKRIDGKIIMEFARRSPDGKWLVVSIRMVGPAGSLPISPPI